MLSLCRLALNVQAGPSEECLPSRVSAVPFPFGPAAGHAVTASKLLVLQEFDARATQGMKWALHLL